MEDILLEVLQYAAPSLVTALLAYYFFLRLAKSEDFKNKLELLKEGKKATMPNRLQAYERLTLVMERINPSKLLVRITPTDDNKELYVQKLLVSIEQEFEHNLSQQIYISEGCWNALIASKNATRNLILEVSKNATIQSSQNLREAVLKKMIDTNAPSNTGIAFIKEEVKEFFS